MGIYLGLDLSTQGLSALVINSATAAITYRCDINFGRDLPQYESPNGFLEPQREGEYHANPLMWLAALDRLFARMSAEGFDLGTIDALSGSGQQHATVYLNERFLDLQSWAGEGDLASRFAPSLARATAPIWMDSSTGAECAEIAAAVGGDERVCAISGSRTIERFSAAQIRKFYKQSAAAYEETAVIHLASSFICSILAGRSSAIDSGDGAGMNLLNLASGEWDSELLAATAPHLAAKLPPVQFSGECAGTIAAYFVQEYGFKRECSVNLFSGDNPNSLVGMGAEAPGTVVVSLGTSDTLMASFDKPLTDPNGYGHVFCNPAGGYMCLLCFTNGSLARERVRDEFALDWDGFEKQLAQSAPGNNGNLMIPFFTAETTPRSEARVDYVGQSDFTQRQSAAKAVRAIVESQFANMKIHAAWAIENITRIKVTGGASDNDQICQIVADIFQVEVERIATSNSAALGAALRAASMQSGSSLIDLSAAFADQSRLFAPDPAARKIYDNFVEKFRLHI